MSEKRDRLAQEIAQRLSAECDDEVIRVNAETHRRMKEIESSGLPPEVCIRQLVEVHKRALDLISDAHVGSARRYLAELNILFYKKSSS